MPGVETVLQRAREDLRRELDLLKLEAGPARELAERVVEAGIQLAFDRMAGVDTREGEAAIASAVQSLKTLGAMTAAAAARRVIATMLVRAGEAVAIALDVAGFRL